MINKIKRKHRTASVQKQGHLIWVFFKRKAPIIYDINYLKYLQETNQLK